MKTKLSAAYLSLSPRTVRRLFQVALTGLWGWFALKFFLAEGRPATLVASALCLLTGVVAAILVFLSDLSFIAHAPERDIDEYQLQQRNRAYLATLRYGCGALAIAWFARTVGGPHAVVSVNVLDNFILVLFLTLLIAPAGFLAQRLLADEEAPAR
jgi:ABC-type amino acid transport system permease subunit